MMYSGKSAASKRQNSDCDSFVRIEEPEDFFFQAINRRGESICCEVLFTFETDGQNYLIYTDNTHTLTGRLNVYATLYHPETLANGKPLYLRDPETNAQWRLIQRAAYHVLELL